MVPLWVRRPRWASLRFYAGARADEVPRAIAIGGEEQPVRVLGSWQEERSGVRLHRYLLQMEVGETLVVTGPVGPRQRWRVDEERTSTPTG